VIHESFTLDICFLVMLVARLGLYIMSTKSVRKGMIFVPVNQDLHVNDDKFSKYVITGGTCCFMGD
jgi:hypothetical protein